MVVDHPFPIAIDVAHRSVRQYLSTGGTLFDHDPLLAACVCLQSSDPQCQADGVAVVARLVDDDTLAARSTVYALPEAFDTPQPRARAQAVATLEQIAIGYSQSAIVALNSLVPRLTDSDPLVREAAYSAVGWIGSEYTDKEKWAQLPDSTLDRFRTAIRAALEQSEALTAGDAGPCEAAFALAHPQEPFYESVEQGTDRTAHLQRAAIFTTAMLAEQFPAMVRTHSDHLADVAVFATKLEARSYAVDALGRAHAQSVLEDIRQHAVELLATDQPEQGIRILSSFIMESPSLLIDAAPDIAATFDMLEGTARDLAAEILLTATAHSSDGIELIDPVKRMVAAWLSGEENSETVYTDFSAEQCASIATAHPDVVLPRAIVLVGLIPSGSASTTSQVTPHPADEEAENAWQLLLETAKQAPDLVANRVATDELRSWLDQDTTDGVYARLLYAHVGPTPPPQEDLETLISQLRTDRDGAQTALDRLAEHVPARVSSAVVQELEGQSAPPKQSLRFLASLSTYQPAALIPLQETVWSWNSTVQPSDSRWSDLLTIIGRIALETDDSATISKTLQFENPVYCSRFLDTPVANALIQAAPNRAIPALLDHLSHSNSRRRRRIVRALDGLPDGYDGWSGTVRDALLDRVTDEDPDVRAAAVQSLAECLQSLGQSGATSKDWATPTREAILQRVTDENRKVQIYAIRALADHFGPDLKGTLDMLRQTETDPRVRFEATRVLVEQRQSAPHHL